MFLGVPFFWDSQCFEPQKCFSGLMCFPILKVHSLQKLHDFFGMCFSLFFLFHFPWFQVWTVTISRNSCAVSCLFCFKFFSPITLKIHESFNDIFLGVCVLIWGTRRFSVEIVWYIYIKFSWHLLLWFPCFCWGSETSSELHFCFALLEFRPVGNPYRPLQYSLSDLCLKIGFLKVPCLSELWNISTVNVFFLNFLLHKEFQWCCLKGLCFLGFVMLGYFGFPNSKVFQSDIHVQIHSVRF